MINAPAERIQATALSMLNSTEMALLEELKCLFNAGFEESEIRRMMGEDTYTATLEALHRVDLEYERLAQPPRRRGRVIVRKLSRMERMLDDE